jgi:alkylation response protein AidB-like acyl-CoA dehydrogenase
MDFNLTAEERQWLEKARGLSDLLRKNAAEYDEAAAFPEENFDALKAAEFHLLQVPKQYGGHNPEKDGNLGLIQLLVAEELAKACPTTSWDLLIHYHQAGLVARMASDEQKRRWFGRMVEEGALMGSLGSEVNPRQLKAENVKTKLTFDSLFEPVDGGFKANGSKHFCSMAPAADLLAFWALAPGTTDNSEGLVISIIDRNSPGLTFEDSWSEAIGLRGTVSWSAHLKDVFIPWEDVLGQPGDFIQKDPYTYECSHAAHLVGCTQGIIDFVVDFIHQRDYLAGDDVLMFRLAEIDSELQAARTSLWYAVWLWRERRFDEAGLASIRALHSAKAVAIHASTQAFDICGTRALFKFHPIERMWREVRTSMLHTRDTQLMRLLADGVLDGGQQFSKQKYGRKLESTPTWEELGLKQPSEKRAIA